MPIDRTRLTYKEAAKLLEERRTKDHESNRKFYDGDHWQEGFGFIGEKPPQGEGYNEIMNAIREGFVSESIIGEIVDRHVGGILGRDPFWRIVPGDGEPEEDNSRNREIESSLIEWWNRREILNLLQNAAVGVLLEETSVIRPFVPPGKLDANNQLPVQQSFPDALNLLRFEVLTADQAGVFEDEEEMEPFGVYRFVRNKKKFVEVTFVDSEGATHLQVIAEKDNRTETDAAGNQVAEEAEPLELGGHLFLFQLRRKTFISEQVRSNQKSLNLSNTMMIRNVNLAGSRERYFLNVAQPKKTTRVPDSSAPGGFRIVEESLPVEVGVGAAMFLNGQPIRDEHGKIKGYSNPNISVTDPVNVETFENTRDKCYSAMLGQCQQTHVLISADATASGRSREQARKEFENSLKLTKSVMDAAGRWLLEVAVRFAARVSSGAATAEAADLRFDFDCLIDKVPLDQAERQENRADVEKGLMSAETAMSRNGIEDTDAEKARIEDERKNEPHTPAEGE